MRSDRVLAGCLLLLAAAPFVCFAQLPILPSSDSAATVNVLAGRVDLMRDSQPWALREGDRIRPGQEIRTGPDGYALFKVADGSTFEVFPNSRVVFRDNPGNWRDLLNLMLGRVKVYIQKWGGEPNLNRVTTPTALITVRGTVFDVQVEDDAESTLISVDEGQVEVAHRLLPQSKRVWVNPGETLRISKNEPLARNNIDRGSVLRGVLRAAAEAVYTAVYNDAGGSRAPKGPGQPTDNTKPEPPPPPPGGGDTPPPPG